ncbi:MAG: hypothetical protein OEV00_11540, partial [Acidobacteriota bacterium]|nr:hypothetical protein [Acidobacteriota bacterium]
MRNFHGRRSLLVFFERLSRHALGRRLMRWMLSMGRGRGATLSPYMADVDLGLLSRAGGAGLLAVNWVSALQGVRSIRDTDRQMPAILYADLLSQPRRIVEKMVGHADLIASDDELDRAARMVTERRDPHVGGRLDPSRQRKWNPTPGIDEAIRQILAAVPDSR